MATKNMLIIGDSQVDVKKLVRGRLGKVMKGYFGRSWAVVLDGRAGWNAGSTLKFGWMGAEGLGALRNYLKQKPQVVIVALGGNNLPAPSSWVASKINEKEPVNKARTKKLVEEILKKSPDSLIVWLGPPIRIGRSFSGTTGFTLQNNGSGFAIKQDDRRTVLSDQTKQALGEMKAKGTERVYKDGSFANMTAGDSLMGKKVVYVDAVRDWQTLYPTFGAQTGEKNNGDARPTILQVDELAWDSYAGASLPDIGSLKTKKYDGIHLPEEASREYVVNLIKNWKAKFWPDDPHA